MAKASEEAFELGLPGVKLHCHVQCISPDDPALHEIYETCATRAKPLIIHASREPKSPGYHCDPHDLCTPAKIKQVGCVPPACGYIPEAWLATVSGAKRHRPDGPHSITIAL
jgi:hypothetical protein